MNKNRLEAFTDAIIAIAATIMVLDLHIPKQATLAGLLADWPIFLAYIISYTLIYTVWSSHHDLFEKAEFISIRTFLLNGLWLFFLTLVPFATNWVGSNPNATVSEATYSLVLLLWSGSFHVMDLQIIKDNPHVIPDNSSRPFDRLLIYTTYSVGFIIAFISPILSLIIIGIMSVIMTYRMFSKNYRSNTN